MALASGAIDDLRLRALYDYWQRKRDDRPLPARADIDPIELKYLLGNLFLVDVAYGPLRFRYRLAGTNIVQLLGRELTGRTVDDLEGLPMGPQIVKQHFSEVVLSREPSYKLLELTIGRTPIVYRRLLLPLSPDGGAVNMLLGGGVYQPAAQSAASPGRLALSAG